MEMQKKRGKKCPGGVKLGIKSHFSPGVGQRSHPSRGIAAHTGREWQEEPKDIPKAGPGGFTVVFVRVSRTR